MKRSLLVVLFALGLMLTPAIGSAHRYDRDMSDYPLRYVAYVVHPIGVAVEYAVLRPIHWIVSKPNFSNWFGHEPKPEVEEDTYFEWI